jgi:molybdate transport system substrate-binding protein
MTRLMTALAALLLGAVLQAAEITVLSGGAIEPGLRAAAAAFEKRTGHKVEIIFNTTPQMRRRVDDGGTFDVVVAPPEAIAEFAKAGKVEEGGVTVGRVGSGVAVRQGAPVPAIATENDIRTAVLDAESIVFNRASTGLYFEKLLREWGIYGQVEGKTVRYATGAEVVDHLLKGKGKEVGFAPITEILLEKDHGLILVGPLPPEIQNYTSYTAVPMTVATQKEIARAFVTFLGGPIGRPLFVSAGIE